MTMQVLRNYQFLRHFGRCTSPFSATKTWFGHPGLVGHSNFKAGLLLQSKSWLSTTTPDTLGPLPDIPLPPVAETMLNTLGEPSLASLGLCSYWPSGWYQALLEALHVSLDLPWWAAIATTTLCIRLCLFPFIIGQRRSLAKYGDAMPRLTLLQERMTNARLSGDYLEMMKVSKEMQEMMRSKDVNPLRSMKLLIVQAGIRGMASLPVPSMKTGGLSWFTDLTVPDPYCLLPFMSMASIILMFETGTDISTKGMTPFMKTALRIFPVFGFLMVMNMP
ncbi:inner membrane protein, partial [Opisthorchis viverrini]